MATINKYSAFIKLAEIERSGNFESASKIEKILSNNMRKEIKDKELSSSYELTREQKKLFE